MTWDASSDLASTLVAVAPSPAPASSLSLTVTAGAGALFPVAPFDVLIHDQAVWPTKTTAEFARVLSVVGDVVTFSARALHGSSARTILVGDRISGVFTAEQLQAIQAQIDANTAAISTNVTAITSKAPLTSPALTGTPTTPTPTPGDNSTKIASTAFVLANAPSGGLTSFQGRSTAAAVLTKADVTGTGLAAADVGAALDSAAVHNTGAETVAGVKTFSSSPIVPDPTTAQQVASRAFVLANAGGGPNAVSRTLSTAGSVSGATPLDMTKDQTRQFVLSGNTVISASAVAANGGRLTLYADQPPSGGLYTLGISDGTTTFPVTDPGWTAGQRMTVLVDWFSPTAFSANVLGVATAPVIPTVPGAPTGVTGTPGNTTASIAFTPPASNGGSAITSFTATLSPGGATFSGSSSPISATGLTNGVSLTATVHATNAIGNSAESTASGSFTPAAATVPGAPTIGTATAGDTTADVPWTAPGSNGGSAITGYTVTPYIGSTAQTPVTVGVVLTAHITGLTDGTAYTFKVAAINAIGTGAQSAASNAVTPTSVGPILAHAKAASADGILAGPTPAIDTTGATLLVVAVGSVASAPAATVTDSKGNTWTALLSEPESVANCQMFYCSTPIVGTGHTFSVTRGAGQTSAPAIAVAASSRTTSGATADVNRGSTGTGGTVQPGSATPARSGELVFTAESNNNAITLAVDSGFTITDQVTCVPGNNVQVALAYLVQTTPAAVNPAWTGTGLSGAATLASF